MTRSQIDRIGMAALGVAIAAGTFLGLAPSASAHAIIDIGSTNAIAGTRGSLTLEIQHGCLEDADGVIQVMAFVGKPWGRIKADKVEGWASTSQRAGSGRQITWTKIDGVPQAFSDPVYFPISVTWPKEPGVYGMTVTQVCPSDTTTWDTPPVPAVANTPSPPLTPQAQVQVMAAGDAGAKSAPSPASGTGAGHVH